MASARAARPRNESPSSQPKPYERLKAWSACHELALAVYRETASWPQDEMHGLTEQARRAALGAAVNVVEGSAKRGTREFREHLDSSVGLLARLACTLVLARDVGIMTPASFGQLEVLRDHASRLTGGLLLAVRRRSAGSAAQSGS